MSSDHAKRFARAARVVKRPSHSEIDEALQKEFLRLRAAFQLKNVPPGYRHVEPTTKRPRRVRRSR